MRTALTAGALTALALNITLIAAPALAGPADYVATPIVERGEREIELNAGRTKLRNGSSASAESITFGWGATSWWFTEFYAKWHREPGARRSFDAWEWENRFQLTETGRYFADLGILLEVERPNDRSEGYEVTWGPLLQTELSDRLLANLNLLWTKHLRASEPGPAELGYRWQLKYRWLPAFEPGLQGFGELGPWNRFAPAAEQMHLAGPAIFGKFALGGRQAIKYNAALLFAVGHGAASRTLRTQLEYEF